MAKLTTKIDDLSKILEQQNESIEEKINRLKEKLKLYDEIGINVQTKEEIDLKRAINILEKQLIEEEHKKILKDEREKEKERILIINRVSIDKLERLYKKLYDYNVVPKNILDSMKKSSFRNEFVKNVLDEINEIYAEENEYLNINELDIDMLYIKNLNYITQKYKNDEQKHKINTQKSKNGIPFWWKTYAILKVINGRKKR